MPSGADKKSHHDDKKHDDKKGHDDKKPHEEKKVDEEKAGKSPRDDKKEAAKPSTQPKEERIEVTPMTPDNSEVPQERHEDAEKKAAQDPVSPPDQNLFSQFPLQNLVSKPSSDVNNANRRASSVSFPENAHVHASGTSAHVSPARGEHLMPVSPSSSGHGAAHGPVHNHYRSARDAYYHHFELSAKKNVDPSTSGPDSPGRSAQRDATGGTSDPVRCHQLASAALALSYLLADLTHTKGKFPNLRVTHEDIITALHLPLNYMTHSHLTLHEIHSIISRFVEQDERLKDDYEVIVTTFDTKRSELMGALTIIEEETGRRQSVLTATELRSTISDDGLTFDRVKIACYDGEIVSSENVIELDDAELQNDELLNNVLGDGVRVVSENRDELRRRPATHSACAVVVDIHRTQNSVQLFQISTVEPLRGTKVDVPLKTLHDALSVRNPDSQRAQGIIEIRKKGSVVDKSAEGTMGVSIGITAEGLSKLLGVGTEPSLPTIPNAFGQKWRTNLSWTSCKVLPVEYHDFTIGCHLLTTAAALHLVNPTKFPAIDVNQLVSDLKLPASEILLGCTVHCQQWYGMLQALAPSRDLVVEYVPLVRHVKKPGAAPFISVDALARMIEKVVSHATSEKGRVVMLAAFHGNKGRQSLNYIHPGENPLSYAIVAGYDEETQSVLLIDCDVKRNESQWVASIDTLHSAMVDFGSIVLVDATQPDVAKEVLEQILPEMDRFTNSVRKVPKYIPVDGLDLGASEALSSGTPLSLCAIAASRLGVSLTLDKILHDPLCNVSHALFPHISLADLARLFNSTSHKYKLNLFATVTTLSTDRANQRRMSQATFASTIKAALDDGQQQIVVNFSRYQLVQAPGAEAMICPNYALILSMPAPDTVMLCDTNPAVESRKYQINIADLYKGCEDVCPSSRRAKGLLFISKNESLMAQYDKALKGFGHLHFRTPASHAFRSTGVPQLQALAMAITAFGLPVRATELFYSALKHGDESVKSALLPISGLRKRLTLQALIQIANTFLEHCSDAKGKGLEALSLSGSSRNGQVTRDDVKAALKSVVLGAVADELKEVLVCVYDVKNAYDVALEYNSAGVVAGTSDDEVVVIDAEPSSWGEMWRCSLQVAAECTLRDPDDSDRDLFGIVKIRRKA